MRRAIVVIGEDVLLKAIGLERGVIIRSAGYSVDHNGVLVGLSGAGLPPQCEVADGKPAVHLDLTEKFPTTVVGFGLGQGHEPPRGGNCGAT